MSKINTFCWSELMTDNIEGSKKFYSDLFSWEFQTEKMEKGEYIMGIANKAPVVGLFQKWDEHANLPNHWGNYLQVQDIEKSTKMVQEFGGKVCKGPFEIPGAGQMSVIQDSSKAFTSLFQKNPCKEPETKTSGIGYVCWNELGTHDIDKAKDFYQKLCGWSFRDEVVGGLPYTIFSKNGNDVAGLYKLPPDAKSTPPHWMTYFKVKDCYKSIEKVEKNSGKILIPAQAVEGVGTYAIIQDPFGASFGIIS